MRKKDLTQNGYIILDNTSKTKTAVRPENAVPIDDSNTIELSDALCKECFCEHCQTKVSLKTDGFNKSRTIMDIIDHKPIRVIIHKHKWQCPNCKQYITIPDCYGDKRGISKDFDKYILQCIQHNPLTTYSDFEKYGVSESYVRKLVKEHISNMGEIKSYCACNQIVFYPFEYNKFTGCCVCGRRLGDGKIMLLDILMDHNADAIVKSLKKAVSKNQCLEWAFCDLDGKIYHAICAEAQGCNTAIIRKLLLKELEQTRDAERKLSITNYNKAINRLIDIINSEGSRDDIQAGMDSGWETLDQKEREMALPLWEKLEVCMDGLHWPVYFDAYLVEKCLLLIDALRENGMPYVTMVHRMLFAVRELEEAMSMMSGKKMYLAFSPSKILENFCVDIDILDKVLRLTDLK